MKLLDCNKYLECGKVLYIIHSTIQNDIYVRSSNQKVPQITFYVACNDWIIQETVWIEKKGERYETNRF